MTSSGPSSTLSALARLREGRSGRASSWDQTGRNKDYWLIAPGTTAVLADLQGPGAITHIWMTSFCRRHIGPSIQRPELHAEVAEARPQGQSGVADITQHIEDGITGQGHCEAIVPVGRQQRADWPVCRQGPAGAGTIGIVIGGHGRPARMLAHDALEVVWRRAGVEVERQHGAALAVKETEAAAHLAIGQAALCGHAARPSAGVGAQPDNRASAGCCGCGGRTGTACACLQLT